MNFGVLPGLPGGERYEKGIPASIHVAAGSDSLKNMQRGVVIGSPYVLRKEFVLTHLVESPHNGRGFVEHRTYVNPTMIEQQIRHSLFFFDKLELALEPNQPPSESMSLLKEEGSLSFSSVSFSGRWRTADLSRESRLQAYQQLAERDGPRWSMGRSFEVIGAPTSNVIDGAGFLFELHEALPMPVGETPIADLIEFRHRRSDELVALRSHLEAIVISVQARGGAVQLADEEMARLNKALSDLSKAITETTFKLTKQSLGAAFNVENAASIAGGFGVGSTIKEIALPIAGAVIMKLGVSLLGAPKYAGPFEYVYRLHKDLAWIK